MGRAPESCQHVRKHVGHSLNPAVAWGKNFSHGPFSRQCIRETVTSPNSASAWGRGFTEGLIEGLVTVLMAYATAHAQVYQTVFFIEVCEVFVEASKGLSG